MIFSLTLIAVLQTGAWSEYPLQNGYVDVNDLSRLDRTAIVSFVRRLPVEHRGAYDSDVDVEEFTVVDGLGSPPGATYRVIGTLHRALPFPPRVAGQRYLLLAMGAQDRQLTWPNWTGPGEYRPQFSLPSLADNEVVGCAIFPTAATTLAAGATAGERITYSLIDSLRGASREETLRAAAFLDIRRYPGWDATSEAQGQPENSYSRRLRAVADGAPPYQNAKLRQVLNDWGIFGSDFEVLDAYMGCLRDDLAFQSPGDFLITIHNVTYYGNPRLPAGYRLPPKRDTADANRWTEAMLAATNLKVRDFLLQNYHPAAPDPAHRRLLATLLEDPDRVARRLVVRFFAGLFNRPEHDVHPHDSYLGDGTHITDYPDLDLQVDFWKDFIAHNSG